MSWRSVVASLSGRMVTSRAVGGETSTQIAARAGGIPVTLTLDGPLPASSAASVMGDTSVGIPSAQSGSLVGAILGVPVVLSHSAGRVSVRRRESAAADLPVPAETTLALEHGPSVAWDRQIIWVGRNDAAPRIDTVPDRVARIIRCGRVGKSLVLGVTNSAWEVAGSSAHGDILDVNRALSAAHGDRFIDIRGYLIDRGLADVGITPTATDLSDIAADVIPESLRSDGTHLNSAGYSAVGHQIYARLVTLGWVVTP